MPANVKCPAVLHFCLLQRTASLQPITALAVLTCQPSSTNANYVQSQHNCTERQLIKIMINLQCCNKLTSSLLFGTQIIITCIHMHVFMVCFRHRLLCYGSSTEGHFRNPFAYYYYYYFFIIIYYLLLLLLFLLSQAYSSW